MALTLESIHQPLNDFFLTHFKTDAASPVMFRFDKFGSVVDDDDFIDDGHPELGPSPALARERFSDLVNRTPIDAGDGATVVLSENSIDDTYFFRLLSPSLPFVPDTDDAATAESTTDAFNRLKADAIKTWNDLVLESSSGLMLQFKPSLATPETWYDKAKTDNWTNQSFTITDTSPVPAPADVTPPSNQLWRLQASQAVIVQALDAAAVTAVPIDRLQTIRERLSIEPCALVAVPAPAPVPAPAVGNVPLSRVRPLVLMNFAATPPAPPPAPVNVTVNPSPPVLLGDTFEKRFRTLDVRDRVAFKHIVADTAPTEPVKSNEISVTFDYCLVNIQRPWYVDAFVNENSWYVPATKQGELTASGPAGNLPLLPIVFVAIRNLEIEANWAVEDVANAQTATDFGPFRVSTGIVDNKLAHVGLQIIGWLVQTMPALPPNDPPAPTT